MSRETVVSAPPVETCHSLEGRGNLSRAASRESVWGQTSQNVPPVNYLITPSVSFLYRYQNKPVDEKYIVLHFHYCLFILKSKFHFNSFSDSKILFIVPNVLSLLIFFLSFQIAKSCRLKENVNQPAKKGLSYPLYV